LTTIVASQHQQSESQCVLSATPEGQLDHLPKEIACNPSAKVRLAYVESETEDDLQIPANRVLGDTLPDSPRYSSPAFHQLPLGPHARYVEVKFLQNGDVVKGYWYPAGQADFAYRRTNQFLV
tara:strand:- start:95 stop:463 length:369 start_codon:yes stop_codon:yes gene_type:complete